MKFKELIYFSINDPYQNNKRKNDLVKCLNHIIKKYNIIAYENKNDKNHLKEISKLLKQYSYLLKLLNRENNKLCSDIIEI